MLLVERINAFVKLGDFLRQFSSENIEKIENIEHNELFFEGFKHQITLAKEHNGWFTAENIKYALKSWSNALRLNNLEFWLKPYTFKNTPQKTVAIIMAGNIPLVGFHDFLSVLISGHSVLVKQSSNDKHLLPYLSKYLEYVEPKFKGNIEFTEGKIENFDAVIATGSDNTARYFEHYFKGKKSIIRNNRNSIGVLNGKETEADFKNLSEDIFRYYGLGCRNVSKLYVPKGYKFDTFFKGIYHWHTIINKAKYANNYDYNKAVYLMSEFDMLENGFFMIKEDDSFSSPIATLFYEFYEDPLALKEILETKKHKIQCIVAKGFSEREIGFGETQKPQLWDYADDVNTIEFLLSV